MAPAIFSPDQRAALQEIAFGWRFKIKYLASEIVFDDSTGNNFSHHSFEAEVGEKKAIGQTESG
jgi:hypothetical protein